MSTKASNLILDLGRVELSTLSAAIQSLHDTVKTNLTSSGTLKETTPASSTCADGKGTGEDAVDTQDRKKVVTMPESAMEHPGKTIIYLRVVFLKISDVDTVKENYKADIFIQAKWREPCLDNLDPNKNIVDMTTIWNPNLYFENIIGGGKGKNWTTWQLTTRGEAWVFERRLLKGTFAETLELMDFPFDVQDLSVIVATDKTTLEVDLVQDQDEMSAITVAPFVEQTEWDLFKHVETAKMSVVHGYSSTTKSYPTFSCIARAARRPGYFYWNIFLVLFFINSLSFTTFSVDETYVQNRLQLSFTLLLTTVSFKFVINRTVPRLSYLTSLDKYVLASIMMLCVMCVWHAACGIFRDKSDDSYLVTDKKVCATMLGVYIVYHTVFVLGLYVFSCKKRRLMKDKDRKYLVKKMNWEMSRRGVMDDFGNVAC